MAPFVLLLIALLGFPLIVSGDALFVTLAPPASPFQYYGFGSVTRAHMDSPVIVQAGYTDNRPANVQGMCTVQVGRNYEVCDISSVNDAGPGTLRTCVENRTKSEDGGNTLVETTTGDVNPQNILLGRLCEVSVGGTIVLADDLYMRRGYWMLDGSTAPSPGLTVQTTGSTNQEGCNFPGHHCASITDQQVGGYDWPEDIIMQYTRWVGDWTDGVATDPSTANMNVDGFNGDGPARVVLHRNTFSYCADACPDFYGRVQDITFSENFVHDGLHPHSVAYFNDAAGKNRERLSFFGNLWAYNHERTVQVRREASDIEYVNNFNYRWGLAGRPGYTFGGGGYGLRLRAGATTNPQRINVVSNLFENNQNLDTGFECIGMPNGANVYIEDNAWPPETIGCPAGALTGTPNTMSVNPWPVMPVAEVRNYVLQNAGTHYRTTAEQAIINEIVGQVVSPLCETDSERCVGPAQEYATFAAATADAQPGDTIWIKGGVYTEELLADVSGTPGNLITYRPFPGETAIISGAGFNDVQPGQEGINCTSTTFSNDPGQRLATITADYVRITGENGGFEFTNSGRTAVDVRGSNNIVDNLFVHNNWWRGISLCNPTNTDCDNNEVAYNEVRNQRHNTGIQGDREDNDTFINSGHDIHHNISWCNGWTDAACTDKVLECVGDTDGGGNSDGFGFGKNCYDEFYLGPIKNGCQDVTFRYNIAWWNTDDGFDITAGGHSDNLSGVFVGHNISYNNGPVNRKGYKGLRSIFGKIVYVKNVAIANQAAGTELRVDPSAELIFGGHTTVLHTLDSGQGIVQREPTAGTAKQIGNYSAGNLDDRVALATAPVREERDNCFADEGCTGNISLENVNFTVNPVPQGATIPERWQFMYDQFETNLKPAAGVAGSDLVDAVVPLDTDIYCATADDDPVTPADPDAACGHWLGAAPDIGAFERQ